MTNSEIQFNFIIKQFYVLLFFLFVSMGFNFYSLYIMKKMAAKPIVIVTTLDALEAAGNRGF